MNYTAAQGGVRVPVTPGAIGALQLRNRPRAQLERQRAHPCAKPSTSAGRPVGSGLDGARQWGNSKVAGLAQKLGQLEAVNRDSQSKYWANLKLLGQPCNFYAICHVSS
jgi:hypothetical protein